MALNLQKHPYIQAHPNTRQVPCPPLPVHADDAQGHDGGGATHNVHGDKHVAKNLPKEPLSPHQVCDGHEGHDSEGHRQIGSCEGHHQVVGGLPELLDDAHRDDDQPIAGDGHEDDDGEHRSDDDLLSVPIEQDLLAAVRRVGEVGGWQVWLGWDGGFLSHEWIREQFLSRVLLLCVLHEEKMVLQKSPGADP